jgi:hypothetical protein
MLYHNELLDPSSEAYRKAAEEKEKRVQQARLEKVIPMRIQSPPSYQLGAPTLIGVRRFSAFSVLLSFCVRAPSI